MLFILGLLISPVLFLVRLNYKKKIIKIWSKYILKFLAIKIYTNLDLEKFTKSKNFLIVCNHVSWLDIILINSLSPVSFIATKEIKFWPLINILTFAANTIFIDRKSLSNLKKINLKIKQALKKNSVCFFPEGRASKGSTVLPFKTNLFESAADGSNQVLPITIQYYQNEKPTFICSYFEGINLIQSFFLIIKNHNLSAKITIHEPINNLQDRKSIAHSAFIKIKHVIENNKII